MGQRDVVGRMKDDTLSDLLPILGRALLQQVSREFTENGGGLLVSTCAAQRLSQGQICVQIARVEPRHAAQRIEHGAEVPGLFVELVGLAILTSRVIHHAQFGEDLTVRHAHIRSLRLQPHRLAQHCHRFDRHTPARVHRGDPHQLANRILNPFIFLQQPDHRQPRADVIRILSDHGHRVGEHTLTLGASALLGRRLPELGDLTDLRRWIRHRHDLIGAHPGRSSYTETRLGSTLAFYEILTRST